MPSPVPTPVAAAIGLVPAVLDGVRRLPGRAVQLPILAVSSALAGLDHARREYDDLALRGERLLARLRGASFDELEDRVEDRLQGTPFAKPYDVVEDALEDAGETVARVATTARARVAGGTRRTASTVSDLSEKAAQRAEQAADTTEQVAEKVAAKAPTATPKKAAPKKKAPAAEGTTPDEQPKGEATPKAPTGAPDVPVETAATAEVVETVEQVVEQSTAPTVTDHDALPLPDYDHMTLGSLRGRLRSLTVEELVQVRDYEKAHASRLPVVTMLDNRIAKLASDATASPSGGDPAAVAAPEKARPRAKGGSKVTPASAGGAPNPPANPAQPRTGGLGMDHSGS